MENIFQSKRYIKRWAAYETALQVGLPIVDLDTCAIICAMLVVWGDGKEFSRNHKLVCELQYAQRKYDIGNGGGDKVFAASLQYYADNLRKWKDEGKGVPPKINAMFKRRYGFGFDAGKQEEKEG